MANTRAMGATAERKIVGYYRSLGYDTFNPMETRFSARLPFGDFLAFNEMDVLLVEAKKNRRAFRWPKLTEEAKVIDKYPFGIEVCYLEGKDFKRFYWDGDSEWVET